MSKSARCFIAAIDDRPAGFIAIQHFPHPKVKNFKRVHRLVVLPDYQGIGIGVKLLEYIGDIYNKQKFKYVIVTSNPSLIYYFNKSGKWKLYAQGRQIHNQTSIYKKNNSSHRLTTSWEYKKNSKETAR